MPIRRSPHSLLWVLLTFVFVVAWAPPAAASTTSDDTTWAVRPVPASDGSPRARVDLTLDPGETGSDTFQVSNFSQTPVTFAITAADGYTNERGRFNMLPTGATSVDSGTWIDVARTVTVGAGATVDVPFTLTVPRTATPGDHAAGIAASVSSTGTDDSGNSIGVESRVGFRVLTRVTGQLTPAYTVSEVDTGYRTAWNPLEPGSLDASFVVRNTGNIRLIVDATATTSLGQSADFAPAPGEAPLELLPGAERRVTLTIGQVWPVFVVPGEVSVSPRVSAPEGDGLQVSPAHESFVAAAVPWPHLLILLAVLLIAGAIAWDRLRAKQRLRRAVAAAREEERKKADPVAWDSSKLRARNR
ncbi:MULTISPECIES: WxL protein peptidoglycan domain-containing protein [Microbacterium]|uniref:WxL protein peptidoglycan domain-containing protein n=1 Tax=Microbacterium TaxID=33882 RepID=UPI0027802C4E|nr:MULTISPECIES: DUF916 domain-containing protein [Microbacterium]MDQ1076462.1 hypothetical protein [Microbacterium sp. SORGH_AS_0969]MDQ1116698.1 hypothetical protein [Microbacterium testaceum]